MMFYNNYPQAIRTVGSLEEVRACPVNMDGSLSVFICPQQNSIFTKQMDNMGNVAINAYKRTEIRSTEYATADMVATLQRQLDDLKRTVGGMRNVPTINEPYTEKSYASVNANARQPYVATSYPHDTREEPARVNANG